MTEMKLYLTETEDTTFGAEDRNILCTVTVDEENQSCRIESEYGDFTEFEYTDYDYHESAEGTYLYLENEPVSYTFRDKPSAVIIAE